MVFLANLGVNLHVCLCGDLQVASAQTLDFLDIGQKSSFPDWKLGSTGKSFPIGYDLGRQRKFPLEIPLHAIPLQNSGLTPHPRRGPKPARYIKCDNLRLSQSDVNKIRNKSET